MLSMPSRLEGGRHRSPCAFGHTTSLWPLAAEAAKAEVLTSRLVSGEAIRRALAHLGGALAASQTLDHQSQSGVHPKKNAATG